MTPTIAPPTNDAADKAVAFFENFQASDLPRLGELYAPQAYFKDPFNEVRGLAEITRIYSHMFVALEQPRFIVTDQVAENSQCFLTWNFEFRFKRFAKGAQQTVRGSSHLKFNAQGLVDFHRDYWDAAEEVYEKLPLLGGLMRWLKQRGKA